MAELKFDAEMAQMQQALAQCHDMVTRRTTVLHELNLRPGERVLEFGCGGGFYAYEAAQFVGAVGRICAIDLSEDQIAAARRRCEGLSHVECQVASVADIPCEDSTFDAAYGVQVLEYVPALDDALRELGRVLRPGGRLLVLATNWDSVVWYSEDLERMKRVMKIWDHHAQFSNLPAILPGRARAVGLEVLRQVPVPILNATLNDGAFSRWMAPMVKAFVAARGVMSQEELDAWFAEFAGLQSRGAYWFSSTPIITEIMRPA